MLSDEVLGVLRRQAFGVAYRMSGSVSDAEDVAQQVVPRLVSSPEAPTEPAAGVTTVATRLSIDLLRRAKVLRKAYVGPWLPDPLVDLPDLAPGPQERVELADSLSQAFLVLLEQLTPSSGQRSCCGRSSGRTTRRSPSPWSARRPAVGSSCHVLPPGTSRFHYYRLLDRLHRGQASPQDVTESQERFDDHYVDSPVWQGRSSA